MTDIVIYTEPEAANALRIPQETLRNARRRHKISAFRQGNSWFYLVDDIKNYIESLRKPICAANPDLLSSKTKQETEYPPTGISRTLTEKEVAVAQRAVKLARKTMKLNSSSRISYLSASGQSPEMRVS